MWDDFYVCRAVPFATMWEAGASHRTWAMYYFLTWGLFVCVFAGLFLWLPCRRLGQTTDKPCITSWPWGGCFLCLQGCSFGYHVGDLHKPLISHVLLHDFMGFCCVCLQGCSFGYHVGDWRKPLISHVLLHHFMGFCCVWLQGCSFGYHAGGWGKPPVDENGKPLYGDVFGTQGADSQVPTTRLPSFAQQCSLLGSSFTRVLCFRNNSEMNIK